MSNPFFKFKQFTVRHDKCAMKVGTDGVLLGAWCDISSNKYILDVGTGSGLIALMVAQRNSSAEIDAIEIDKMACEQARENVQSSPFNKQISVIHSDFNDFIPTSGKKYDHIVSNPPYFINALSCPDAQRNTARHANSLLLPSFLEKCRYLLADNGRISIVLPYDQKAYFLDAIKKNKYHLSRFENVYPTITSDKPKRFLAELALYHTGSTQIADLYIETNRLQYTEKYISLTNAFYLKM